jgi:uncharacterized protein
MNTPESEIALIAYKSIVAHITKQTDEIDAPNELSDMLKENLACFVSIHKTDGSLRGCIGTIEPKTDTLYHEIITNAISAASQDPRFQPVTNEELEDIEVSVDVLSKPEEVTDLNILNSKKYGIIVSDGSFRRAVLLPDIESVDSVEKQLRIVKKKAGLTNVDNNQLIIKRFTTTRYI